MIIASLTLGCGSKAETEEATECCDSLTVCGCFRADSAFALVKAQTDMGPRTPGSQAHKQCEELIISKLRAYGADSIISQRDTLTAWDNARLPMHNILGQYNVNAPKRILLVAHYDTRPWADNEEDESLHNQPIPGANDGGSGVAVLLELARQLGELKPEIGVDLLFTDLEDYGQSEGFKNDETTWAMGAQYFANHLPYTAENKPMYCIGVDMVGGTDATFHRGYFSQEQAADVIDKVWSIAAQSGYGDRFVNINGGAIVDDFLFISRAGIPAINIIETKNKETRTFPSTWHTLKDDINHIDPNSLKAVGETLLNLIISEQ